ncbi:MAG: cbb3-type cytochrome oxidase assembly protein CcoS [Flavobacteriaceae bacterium]|nr:MAG: cbb3-type cytochrome oxidase assembly protein CcoS [Flavobacteriaceae bacterium]
MGLLTLMILCSVSLGALFLLLFILSAKSGQFTEGEAPGVRMLKDNYTKEENN